MGYDLQRFPETVDEELVCSICSGVLEDPVQIMECEHTFCRACIEQWLARNASCPVDRVVFNSASLCRVPRIMRTLLGRLSITCEYAAYGCSQLLKLDELHVHLLVCQYNPNIPVLDDEATCEQCSNHSCTNALRAMVCALEKQVAELRNETGTLKCEMNRLKRELAILWEFMRRLCLTQPGTKAMAKTLEEYDIARWTNSLTRPSVVHWGGLISTPDDVLMTAIATALAASGCPTYLVHKLIANSHESNWPAGLNSLEGRQTNRHIVENFICHRIPDEQAVVALSCLNPHLSPDMMIVPGLVFIFAVGVE